MNAEKINIDSIKGYIYAAFKGDYECIGLFDPKYPVSSWEEAAQIVFDKIEGEYSDMNMVGLDRNGEMVGFFVYTKELLISFGINVELREETFLSKFWEIIKLTVGEPFQCVLHSVNKRAVGWLERCGMKILFESVTILGTSKN